MTPNERRLTALLRAAFSDYTAYTADNQQNTLNIIGHIC